MPFIRSTTTCAVPEGTQVKLEEGLAEILQKVCEKPRTALAVQFSSEQSLFMSGEKVDHFAVLEMMVAGTLSKEQKKEIVAECNALYAELLCFMPHQMYIIFTEVSRENWGLRGSTLG